MNCPNCNAPLAENEQFCTACGTQLTVNAPAAPVVPAPPVPKPMTKEDLPSQFRVLSPWAYFGLQILYGIPVVGFIFLLIHTFSSANLNRRSFARSYWCGLILVAVVAIVVAVIAVTTGLLLTPVQDFSSVEMFR
jgi:drug/metabolite transporter (DMT)-like permease